MTGLRKEIYALSNSRVPFKYHRRVFGGAAFNQIGPENGEQQKHQLHEPTTWKPYQLAVALLKDDLGIESPYLARLIRPTNPKTL